MKQIKYLMGTFLALAVACAPEEDVQGGSKFGQTAVLLQKEGAKVADFSSPWLSPLPLPIKEQQKR